MFNIFSKITPTSFFVFTSILFEIAFIWVTPPLQAPDEFNHFYRAYQISEGYFLPQQTDRRLGGEIPYDVTDFAATFELVSRVSELKPNRNGSIDSFENKGADARCYKDFPNTSYYSPISYLPQAFCLFVLQKFNASVATLYYGGRIFGFLVSLLAMVFVIRNIPVYKWLFVLLALLPMNLFIINSFSADNVTNSLSFLFIAIVLKYAVTKDTVTNKVIVYLLILVALLALAKVVYIGLVLLIFIIPANNFKSTKQRWVSTTLIFAVSILFVSLWSSIVMKNYLNYQGYNPAFRDGPTLVPGADYYGQKAHILNNGSYFIKVIANSIFNSEQTYLSSYIGRFGAFLDVPLPIWLVVISYLIIFVVVVFEKKTSVFSLWQTSFILISAFFCFAILLLSQHLTWDVVGKGRVDLIQGRYLVPLFPLVFIVLGNVFRRMSFNVAFLVVPFVFLLNCFSVGVIYKRYFYDPYDQIVTYTCDTEHMDTSGNFKTSSPEVTLAGCHNQTDQEKRNGNYSAILSPSCAYCFTYIFKNFNQGDMIDVGAWVKGDVALTISGGRKACGEFYKEFSDKHYVDRNGWTYLRGLMVISDPCDTINTVFFVLNKGSLPSYVDDLTFTFKKNK